MNSLHQFRKKFKISVTIDPLLHQYLKPTINLTGNVTEISFTLFDFIYLMGSIQTRRPFPTKRNNLLDFLDVADCINLQDDFLKFKTTEVRNRCGAEVLTYMSEQLGVGLSAVANEQLLGLKRSTVTRIIRNTKRPDWTCLTEDDLKLVVESKGSISQNTSNNQQIGAVIQKREEPAVLSLANGWPERPAFITFQV